MAYNRGPPYGAPGHSTPQYTAYRPPVSQQQQRQRQQQGDTSQHGAPKFPQHQGPYHRPSPPPQHYADSLAPAMSNISIEGMVPAPLRLQRKPVPGPGMPQNPPPVTHMPPAQSQQQAPYPSAGYFSPPTPVATPYAASSAVHQAPAHQFLNYTPSSPTPPVSQQWHAAPAHLAQGQPTPPTMVRPQPVFEMEAPLPGPSPSVAHFEHGVSATAQPEPAQLVQPFIAELQGSEPLGHVDRQPAQGAQDAQSLQQTGMDHKNPGGNIKTEPTQSVNQHDDSLPGRVPAPLDSEGLIPIEPPRPPDHEGLIPFHAPGSQPADLKPSAGSLPSSPHPGQAPQPTPNASQCPEPSCSAPPPTRPPLDSAAQTQQVEQQTYQQPHSAHGGQGPSQPIYHPEHRDPHTEARYPQPSSPYTSAPPFTPPAHQWPAHGALPPSTQQPTSPPPPSTATAFPTAGPYHNYSSAPTAQSPTGVHHFPAAPIPPGVAPSPTTPHPGHSPHPGTLPIRRSHSPSPTPPGPGVQISGPSQTPGPPAPQHHQQPSFPPPPPRTPTTATYSPAAFPAKPATFPPQPSPLISVHGGPQPSAIPSTPSITPSLPFSRPASAAPQYSFAVPPKPQAHKPARPAGTTTSFQTGQKLGDFANSVFSKETVKWSKKTASRLGGAIKNAASNAHAAATNAQVAASQAAAMQMQRSISAAQAKVASGAKGLMPAAASPQPAIGGQAQELSLPVASGAAAPTVSAHSPSNLSQASTGAGQHELSQPAPYGQAPGWLSAAGAPAGSCAMASGPGYVPQPGAGAGLQQPPQSQGATPPLESPQGPRAESPYPNPNGQGTPPQPWQAVYTAAVNQTPQMPPKSNASPATGGQPPPQSPPPPIVAGQQTAYGPVGTPSRASNPMIVADQAVHPQQQWVTGQGQTWRPQAPAGASTFGPGRNAQAHTVAVESLPPQHGSPSPASSAPHLNIVTGSANGQSPPPNWQQQPPPPWHVAAQQQAWVAAGAPPVGGIVPPLPQGNGQQQPFAQLNPAAQQVQAWPHVPLGNHIPLPFGSGQPAPVSHMTATPVFQGLPHGPGAGLLQQQWRVWPPHTHVAELGGVGHAGNTPAIDPAAPVGGDVAAVAPTGGPNELPVTDAAGETNTGGSSGGGDIDSRDAPSPSDGSANASTQAKNGTGPEDGEDCKHGSSKEEGGEAQTTDLAAGAQPPPSASTSQLAVN